MNLYLQTIIYKIIADMDNASIHHIIYARYYFFGQRMHGFEPVHINSKSVRELVLTEYGINCRMMLDAETDEHSCSIVIPFDSIRKIIRIYSQPDAIENTLFLKPDIFKSGKVLTDLN